MFGYPKYNLGQFVEWLSTRSWKLPYYVQTVNYNYWNHKKLSLHKYLLVKITMLAFFRFYIGCDRCQDWFHGSCVGISKAEADELDTYVCPNCRSSADSVASTKIISDTGRIELTRLVKTLQVYLQDHNHLAITWLWNISGPMVRHYCHGSTIFTHPSLVLQLFKSI